MKSLIASIASVLLLAAACIVQAQPFAYIAENGSGNVSVINTPTNAVVATVALGAALQGIAVNPAGTRIYATTFTGDRTFVVNTATLALITTGAQAAGFNPAGIAFNATGTRGYVANVGVNSVLVFDPATFAALANVPVGVTPVRVAVNPAGTRVYVTNAASNNVSVIDTTNNTVVGTVVVGTNPRGVAVNPTGSRVYVTNASAGSVSVIDTSTNLVIATVAVGTNPDSVAVNPAGTFAYVTNGGSNSVSVIDTAGNTVVATVPVGSAPEGVALNPAGTFAYVANFGGGSVSVIDTGSNTVVATTTVGSNPRGVAVNPTNNPMIPGVPTAVTAVAGDGQATVSYTPPAFNGGSTIITYTATSNPGGIQGFTTGGPIIVSGLTNGTPYTFAVTATNAVGVGVSSAASNTVTPTPALVPCLFIPASGAWNVPANWANCAGGNGVPVGTPGTANRADIADGTAILPAGTFDVGDINLSGTVVIQGAGLGASTLNVVNAGGAPWGGGTYTFQNMTIAFTGSSLPIGANGGLLTVANSVMSLSASAVALVADTVIVTGAGAKFTNNGIFGLSNSLTMTAGGVFENNAGAVFSPASGLITINGAFINQGAFLTNAGAPLTLTNAAAFSQNAATGFIVGNGSISAVGQVLTVANGFIEGDLVFNVGTLNNTGAVVAPGGFGVIGTINVNGNYSTSAAAPMEIEVAANVSFPSIDQLIVSGSTTLTNPIVDFFYIDTGFGPYVPAIGDALQFITSGSLTGLFAGFSAPLTANVASVSHFATGVQFIVTAPAPAITVSGTTAFPGTVVGASSAVQAITITNSGTTALTLSSITHSNASIFPDTTGGPAPRPGHYCGFGSLAGGAPNTGGPINIAPGGTCVLNLIFSPNAVGALTGTITINSNAPTTPTLIAVSGTGLAGPAPVITSPATAGGVAGAAFLYQIVATNAPTSFGATGLPAGLTVNAATGQITGTPAATGTFAAAVTATNGGGTGSQALTITVTAAPVAPTITSGAPPAGTVGTPYSFTFTATGTAPITWSIVTGAAPTGLTLNPATGVLSGTPTTAGPSGFLVQAANGTAPNATQNVSITIAAAVLLPAVTLAPATINFGTRTVNTTSPPTLVTLTNSGTAGLVIFGIVGTGDFGFTTTCPISTPPIAAAANCAINITFTPLTVAALTGTISITSNAPGSPHVIALSGTGSAVAVPGIGLAPAALAFGAQTVNTISALQSVVVINTGFANLTLSAIAVSAPFIRVPLGGVAPPDCGASLAPGSSCQIAVSFTPTAVGAVTGQISITDNAAGSPHLVALSGTGTPLPVPVINANATIAFGDQIINTTGTLQNVIGNAGTATLNISAITLTGANAASFTLTGQSGCAVIAPSASCTLTLTFTPTTTGAKTAQINLTSNAQNAAAVNTQTLTGNGILAPRPILNVTSTAIGFGNTIFGGATSNQIITLSNSGGQAMNIASIVASGDFLQTNNCPASLASLASCTISVLFTPLAQGTRSGEIVLTTSATTSPDRIPLSGTGCRWFSQTQSRLFVTACGG